MGGRVTASSELNRGSLFVFEVNLPGTEDPAAQPAQPVTVTDTTTAHVLIADDNAANRLVAETLCGMFDCTCESVENGAEAVRLAGTGRFDMVLMDIKMPVMDGLEATRHIRALSAACAALPIIALTANADPRDAQAYLAGGMDAVVEKPIKPEALLAAMRRVLALAPDQVAA